MLAFIITAMGFENGVVVGRSGGAIISLELAATRPELINFLIVHEAPVIELLPPTDAEKWRSFSLDIYAKSQREGWKVAQTEFMSSLTNVPNTPYPPNLNDRLEGNVDFFFKHEYRPFFTYQPNIGSIRNNNVRMVTAIGKESKEAYYVQATRALAAQLGCENIEFPGHHDVSFWMPEKFADAVRQTVEQHSYNRKEY